MNDNQPDLAKRSRVLILLAVEDDIEREWANVLGCGAPGPSHAEPALFHQGAEDRSESDG
jgi:hypothetical protein